MFRALIILAISFLQFSAFAQVDISNRNLFMPMSQMNNPEQFDFPAENALNFENYDFELENIRATGTWCTTANLDALAKAARWTWSNPGGKKVDFFVVDKTRRWAYALVGGKVVRTYRVALGKKSPGAKRQEGDNKTPEGLYRIGYKNPNSSFHLSMQISYPNAADIEWAKKHGVSPGSGIMLHGLPNNPFVKPLTGHPNRNWTAGCVAVNDKEIEELYSNIPVGIPVELCK